jgi:hypothetical protein
MGHGMSPLYHVLIMDGVADKATHNQQAIFADQHALFTACPDIHDAKDDTGVHIVTQ